MALDRIIRISGCGEAQFCGCVGASAATARVHRGEWLRVVGEHQVSCSGDSVGDGAAGGRRLAQKLTVSGVAEIELAVAPAAGREVGSHGYGLRFESFQGRFGRGFRGYDRGDGGLTIHGDYCEQRLVGWFDFKQAAIVAGEFAWDGEVEVHGIVLASGDGEARGLDGVCSCLNKNVIFKNANVG